MPKYQQTTTIRTTISAPELDADSIRSLQRNKEDFWRGIMILNPVLKGDDKEEPTIIVEITPMDCPIEGQEREMAFECHSCKHSEQEMKSEPCYTCVRRCTNGEHFPLWEPKEKGV